MANEEKVLVGVKITFRNAQTQTVNLLVNDGYRSEIEFQISNWVSTYRKNARSWEWLS